MRKFTFILLKTGANESTDKILKGSCFTGHMNNFNRLVELKKLIVSGPMIKNEKLYRGIFILDVPAIEKAKILLKNNLAIKA